MLMAYLTKRFVSAVAMSEDEGLARKNLSARRIFK